MATPVFPRTAARVAEWRADPDVLGVVQVGSKSRGHGDDLSDDDLEVLLTDEAAAKLQPTECLEVLVEGEGGTRRLVYDVQLTALSDLVAKRHSTRDLDRWPYESAPVLFDRDGRVAEAVAAAGRMDPGFRRRRLLHATIDAWVAPYRATRTRRRGYEAAARLLIARGARALVRVVFALEARWMPLEHWLEPELASLADPAGAGPLVLEALREARVEPLEQALARLEEPLVAEGVPRPAGRRDLFLQLIHASNAADRDLHFLGG